MNTLHRNFCIILLLFFVFSATAQKQTPPPGTAPLNPSETETKHAAFIDNEVITVFAWLEYLWWIAKEHGEESAEYKACLPDILICEQVYPDTWRNAKYRKYPIVGITYEQAGAYCAWRSDRVNEMLKLQKNQKKYGYTVTYSLPTENDLREAYRQFRIGGCFDYDYPVNELTAEKTVMIKVWRSELFQPYQEADFVTGFRCVAEVQK